MNSGRIGGNFIKRIFFLAGIFCIACAAAPSLIYGILNTGVWSAGIIGVLCLLIWRFWDKIRQSKLPGRILIILITAGGFYVILMSVVMINRAYFSEPPGSGDVAVIVLGGGIVGDQPSLMLRRRLDKAYDYMRENDSAICVVTGGQGPDEIMPEALVMKNYLIARGIEPDKIMADDKSENTRQNLAFAAELIPEGYRSMIATDGFHQLRAQIYANMAGVDAPYTASSLTPWGLLPTYWLRELLGMPVAMWLSR